MKKIIFLLLCTLTINAGAAQGVASNKNIKYAIVVPMQDESIMLLSKIHHKKKRLIDGMRYTEGTLKEKAVVFANTGLGKTNVSAVTARLIHDYHPEFIVLAGSSGSINSNLSKNSVIIGARVIDADLGTLTTNGPYFPNEEYFTTAQKNMPIPKSYVPAETLINAAKTFVGSSSKNKVLMGSIATTDVLPNQTGQVNLLKLNRIDVVEMEGASFMQTCWLFNTKCLVVRGVSNDANEGITKKDTIQAGNNAAHLVVNIIDVLP